VSLGERNLWFTGALFLLAICGVFLYAIFRYLFDSNLDESLSWVTITIVLFTIFILAGYIVGSIRRLLGFPELDWKSKAYSSKTKNRATSMIWIANIFGSIVTFFVLLYWVFYVFGMIEIPGHCGDCKP